MMFRVADGRHCQVANVVAARGVRMGALMGERAPTPLIGGSGLVGPRVAGRAGMPFSAPS